jgi:hypothetical protein
VTFGNANHTTKNGLPAQYLVSKDVDPQLLQDTHLFAKERFIITDSTILLLTQKRKQYSVFDMTYWPNMHVHAQLYFALLQTSQFLSFAVISLPADHGRSMPPRSD